MYKTDSSRTYIGIVEENNDPRKLGRCKIRVIDIFDDIPVEDIPWASPWKDLNGNGFNVPEKGKIVTVIFDSGNIYKPEYIYAEHYNINLENKLKSLDGKNYTSMKSLIFDHKTQIYVNDEEGLKLDHKYNNINIIEEGININLKDNFGRINIGDSNTDQQSILGTNFLEWFDEFVSHLLGEKGGAYIGNLVAPVVPNPGFVAILQKYRKLKYRKFLSRNIYMSDNGAITSVRFGKFFDPNLRINIPQEGDDWKSTKMENVLLNREEVNYEPAYGNGTETPGSFSPNNEPVGLSTNEEPTSETEPTVTPPVGEVNPDVLTIIDAMYDKKYEVQTKPFYINIVGIRYQYEDQNYSNQFIDKLWAIWKNDSDQWESKNWPISTLPGLYMNPKNKIKMKEWCKTNRTKGLGILVPAQYKNVYKFFESELSEDLPKMTARPTFRNVGNQLAYRDKNWESDKITFSNKENVDSGDHGMWIHRGFPGGYNVNNWSQGCQVFSKDSDYKQFCNLARVHIQKHGNSFNYTLMLSADVS